jgi:hypothetical protein
MPRNSPPDGNKDGDGEQSDTPPMPDGWVIGEEDTSAAAAAVSAPHPSRLFLTSMIAALFVLTLSII